MNVVEDLSLLDKAFYIYEIYLEVQAGEKERLSQESLLSSLKETNTNQKTEIGSSISEVGCCLLAVAAHSSL